MQPDESYIEKIAARGSSLYYSLLFSPNSQKQALKPLYALFHEINRVSEIFREESIAQLKLNWWKNEIINLYAEKPNHPLSKALLPVIREWHLPLQLFLEYIEGQLLKFDVSHCCTEKDFELYAYRNSGIPCILSSYITSPKITNHIAIANQIGTCLEIINLILKLRLYAHLGRVYFPQSSYEKMGLTYDDFLSGEITEKITSFFEVQREKAHQIFKANVPAFKSFNHLLTLTRIRLTQLDETALAGYPVFKEKICLTALRKLWISWKVK